MTLPVKALDVEALAVWLDGLGKQCDDMSDAPDCAAVLRALLVERDDARNAALEEAALSAEREAVSRFWGPCGQFAVESQKLQRRRIAAGIRALKDGLRDAISTAEKHAPKGKRL